MFDEWDSGVSGSCQRSDLEFKWTADGDHWRQHAGLSLVTCRLFWPLIGWCGSLRWRFRRQRDNTSAVVTTWLHNRGPSLWQVVGRWSPGASWHNAGLSLETARPLIGWGQVQDHMLDNISLYCLYWDHLWFLSVSKKHQGVRKVHDHMLAIIC